MTEWYRNRHWSEEIEAEFERRLSRSRDAEQKLKIQGYELLESDPQVAARLLERCADLDGEWAAAACLYLAQALLRMGAPHGSLGALDRALAEQQRPSRIQTDARTDWLLLVAMLGARKRYREALACMTAIKTSGLPGLVEERIAEALIRDDLGEREVSRPLARSALTELTDLSGNEPSHGSLIESLLGRLRAIASA